MCRAPDSHERDVSVAIISNEMFANNTAKSRKRSMVLRRWNASFMGVRL